MGLYSQVIRSVVLPLVSPLTKSEFWDVYERLSDGHATAWPSLHATAEQAVESLLAHSGTYVPLYRERFHDLGINPLRVTAADLHRLPVLTKAHITSRFPEGIISQEPVFLPWRYVSTSGTLSRLTAIHDFRKRDASRAASLLSLRSGASYHPGMRYLEIPPDVCRDTCGLSNTVEPRLWDYLRDNFKSRTLNRPQVISDIRGLVESQIIYRRLRLPSYWSSALVQSPQVLDLCLDRIRQYRPAVLKAQAVYLYLLAAHLLDTGHRVPMIGRGILPMGSLMSPVMKQTVERAFGCPVFEDYGCAELGGIGAECRHRTGIHPFSGLFHTEIVRNGRSARAGEVGRILLTDLYSYAMPFLRYEIGDVARVAAGECPCGADHRFSIEGRLEDCLLGENSGIVTPSEIIDLLLALPGVLLFQIEASQGGALSLQVVPRAGVTPSLDSLREVLRARLGLKTRIQCRLVSNLRPEASGKFRWVKNLDPAIKQALG